MCVKVDNFLILAFWIESPPAYCPRHIMSERERGGRGIPLSWSWHMGGEGEGGEGVSLLWNLTGVLSPPTPVFVWKSYQNNQFPKFNWPKAVEIVPFMTSTVYPLSISYFVPGSVLCSTGGGVRRNSGRRQHGTGGKVDSKSDCREEMNDFWIV